MNQYFDINAKNIIIIYQYFDINAKNLMRILKEYIYGNRNKCIYPLMHNNNELVF